MAWICRQTHVTFLQMLNIDGQGQQSKLKFKFNHFIRTRDVFHTVLIFMLFSPLINQIKNLATTRLHYLKLYIKNVQPISTSM